MKKWETITFKQTERHKTAKKRNKTKRKATGSIREREKQRKTKVEIERGNTAAALKVSYSHNVANFNTLTVIRDLNSALAYLAKVTGFPSASAQSSLSFQDAPGKEITLTHRHQTLPRYTDALRFKPLVSNSCTHHHVFIIFKPQNLGPEQT